MIEIFTGPAEAVRAAVFERARGAAAPALLVDSQSSPDRSWNGLLGLLSQVAAAAGEERLLSRLARDGSAAGLLLDELAWPVADERRRQGFRAHLTSHLSHNWAVQKPLFDAWAEILAGLLEDTPGRLAVPDLGRLDWESLAVLKALYRRPRTPELLLGYDPQPAAPEPDERGLLWTLPREYALDAFLGFRSLPRVTCREVPPARGAQTGELLETGRQDPPEWDLESRAWRRLADSRPLSAEEVEQVVEAQRRAFHRFGFTSVLRLGLALFDRRAELSPRQTASVHARLALAAHNRQFHSAGNLRLAEVLDHHLRLALAAEDRPAVRSALFYRLAVTAGRRRGRVEEAADWAERAVDQAREVPDRWLSAYLEAWGRNIGSYALLRAGRRDEAKRDCERGYERLRQAHDGDGIATGAVPTPRDLSASLALMATNRSVLSWLDRDPEDFERWRGAARELEWHQPGAARFEAGGWVEFYRRQNRLDLALEAALGGLDSARGEHDALYERRFLLHAADLCYRLGAAAEARRYYLEEKDLRRRLGDPPFFPDPAVAVVGAWLRSGGWAEARELIDRALAGERPPAARAELWAAAAVVAAHEGDEARTEQCLERSIEQAVDSGARDVLIHVAVQAGEALARCGRRDEAAEAYRRALEVAGTGDEPPRPGDLLKARVGLAEVGGRAGGDLFESLPEALDDPDCWWLLPRLLALCPAGPPADAPQAGWQAFVAAVAQRRDVAPAAGFGG